MRHTIVFLTVSLASCDGVNRDPTDPAIGGISIEDGGEESGETPVEDIPIPKCYTPMGDPCTKGVCLTRPDGSVCVDLCDSTWECNGDGFTTCDNGGCVRVCNYNPTAQILCPPPMVCSAEGLSMTEDPYVVGICVWP